MRTGWDKFENGFKFQILDCIEVAAPYTCKNLLLALCLLDAFRKPLPEVMKARVIGPIGTSQSWSRHGYRNSFVEIDGRRIKISDRQHHWGGRLFVPCS